MDLQKQIYIKNVQKQYYTEKYKKKKKEEKQKETQVEKYRELAKDDIMYRILNALTVRATTILKNHNIKRKYTHIQLIGCSLDELKNHLSQQFTEGMTFENYGKGYGNWEVDHIKPISSFSFKEEDEILNCFNYKNLQPLWMPENRSKGAKV
jgi:hypothetical protein